jgi:competence ComEA-like helix-hairpin-helix protein
VNATARRAYAAVAFVATAGHLACWLAANAAPVAAPVTFASLPLRLNPNTASAAELALLPRIGPALAEAIVAYRTAAPQLPAFRSAADLDRVSHIGPATVEAMRGHLFFPDAP